MAEKKVEAAEGAEAPKKGKGKLFLFIGIGVLLVVLLGGAAAYFLLAKKAPNPDEEEEVATKSEKAKKGKKKENAGPPAFYKFDKPFTVKLQAEAQEAYLQVDVQLRLLDPHLSEEIKAYDPELKHRITLLLLGKKSTDLNNPQGVQKLSNEIRQTINRILEPSREAPQGEPKDDAEPDAPVQAVLFTTFIVQ